MGGAWSSLRALLVAVAALLAALLASQGAYAGVTPGQAAVVGQLSTVPAGAANGEERASSEIEECSARRGGRTAPGAPRRPRGFAYAYEHVRRDGSAPAGPVRRARPPAKAPPGSGALPTAHQVFRC